MKFYDKVGFAVSEERDPINHPGVYIPEIREKPYRGDVLNLSSRWENSNLINDDLRIDHKISIICDGFIENHFHAIKYVWFEGTRWKVIKVEVARPRLVLNTGGEYNDESE